MALSSLPLATASGGADTYNNLFTDLSPIVALFGEQVSKQFLAQSTRFSECVLFASAPLGLLTGIISAIRIGGYPWLKAVVGRAAESKAAAGLELTSATSSSICELWDGRSVVRVHGAPNILTVVYLEPSKTSDSHISGEESACLLQNSSANDFAHPALADFESAKSLDWVRLKKSRGSKQRWKATQVERNRTLEWEQDEETLPYEQTLAQPRKPIPPIPPNIALNTTRRPSAVTIRISATLAFSLQASVLIFGAIFNYQRLSPSNKAHSFAFPLMAIGTACVGLGMTMCASVVILNSRQERWRAIPRHQDGRQPRVTWLQRKQTVNDEVFLPYAITPIQVCHVTICIFLTCSISVMSANSEGM